MSYQFKTPISEERGEMNRPNTQERGSPNKSRHIYRCKKSGARFVCGELGMRLLGIQSFRNALSMLDASFQAKQSTQGFEKTQ